MSELLAPAGTIEAFYAAIDNGCDAVYLGLDKFSARAYASNFSLENLKELVEYAHLRNVKIYVAMNTIVYDYELNEIYRIIDELAKMHVDALIIQDLSILDYVLNNYKSIEVHASTQMGIDDIEGASLLKKLGFKRIVFARETPLHVLRNIKNNIDIEIETFVHGALCVSYSGNCLMSSMIGERSGNRGRCAGCCRQIYTLIDLNNNKNIKTGYLLSMKDLNLSSFIDEMKFIDSFKIEGRMKDSGYVANIVNYYRKKIDGENTSIETLDKVFNRTYTKGFINNESSFAITNIERPNNYGFQIGEVVKVDNNKIWIKLFKPLRKGDQIRIENNNVFEEISIPVTKLFDANFKECEQTNKIAIIFSNKKIKLKDKVYKTKDVEFNIETNKLLENSEYKKIEIDMEFTAVVGKPILLKLTCNKEKIYAKSEYFVQKAINSPTTKDNIFKQLNKLNDTPYKIKKLDINVDDDVFISLKEINELRRKAITKLNSIRLKKDYIIHNNDKKLIIPAKHELFSPEITVEVNNDEQYEVVKQLGIKHIYYKDRIKRNNTKFIDDGQEILFGGLNAINYYKDSNKTLISDYSLNVTNHKTCAILSSLGVNRITLSHEISKDNIQNLINNYYDEYQTYPNLELIVYGRTHVMHSKYCPLKRLNLCGECKKSKFALKDKLASFPILFNDDCSISILNSRTLNIMDDVSDLFGINYYRLVFTTETKDEVFNILSSFKNKLENNTNEKLFNNKNDTRGHFFKNPL